MNADRLARIIDNCDMSGWHAVAARVGIHSPPHHPADLVDWLERARYTAATPAATLLQAMADSEWSLQWYPPSGGPDFASQIRFGLLVGGVRWIVWTDREGGPSARAAVEVFKAKA